MAVSPAQVVLYATEPADFQIALSAATVAGIPPANVCGDFFAAWQKVANGSFIVIAVGVCANNALCYNPCGWANPAGSAAGTTPFVSAGAPQDTLHGANHYLNGAGQTGLDTLQLTVMLSYYATHGQYPPGFGSQLPPALQAENACRPRMSASQGCPCCGSARVVCPRRPAPGAWTRGSLSHRTGIDISSNNTSETTQPAFWTKAKNEDISFAIIKVSEGVSYVNPNLQNQYRAAVQTLGEGSVGLYHFLDWQYPGDRQAQHFYETTCALAPPFTVSTGLKLWLDAEEPNGTSSTGSPSIDVVAAFMGKLAELCGVEPALAAGVYTNRNTWVNLLGDPTSFSTHPLWAAEPNGATSRPAPFGGWSDWTVLQYATNLTIAGYGGFDGNQLT